VLDVELPILPGQMGRQAGRSTCDPVLEVLAADGSLASARARSASRSSKLAGIEPFGTPAKLAALKLLDNQP
jgi:hypothetical protein